MGWVARDDVMGIGGTSLAVCCHVNHWRFNMMRERAREREKEKERERGIKGAIKKRKKTT